MTQFALHAAAGAVTGLIIGLTGVGGGALMTPMLLLVFGVAPQTAVGTDLWFAALTKLAITPMHRGKQLIDWLVLRRLWLGSLPASVATATWIHVQPFDAAHAARLRAAIAVAVCLTAIGMVSQRWLSARANRMYLDTAQRFVSWQRSATVVAGALLGILVTLTSVGAGALGVVVLVYLYPTRLSPPRLIATDIAHAIPLAMFAGTAHLVIGNVDRELLTALLAGSIPGGIAGAALSSRLRHGALRLALAAILLVVGAKLAFDAW
jgi:hypothetical protein